MAGIGIQLNRIFQKKSFFATLHGVVFSVVNTVAPMLLVIGCLLLMFQVLGFDQVALFQRELFSCTVLYIFIFALLTCSPFNSVLSKYMADQIYAEQFENVRPCILLGTSINMVFSASVAIPFYLWEFFVGKVEAWYVLVSFLCYLSLAFVFSSMVYNSVLKAYGRIALFFLEGMLLTLLISLVLVYGLREPIDMSMLLALTAGFLFIALREIGNVLRYFKTSSYQYKPLLNYFGRYWRLVVSNFSYTFGMFLHNLVFWSHPWRTVLVNTYVCNQAYDMATCIAMFTNISASTFFISRVEMHFRGSYADYMEAVIGGRLDTIEKCKKRMFSVLNDQIFSLVRLQLCISVVIFFACMVCLPAMGISGLTMQIYPLMAAAYFISFLFYSELLFLYYFNDLNGAAIGCVLYCILSGLGSWAAMSLPVIWYGAGFFLASFAAFTYCYFRLRWIERNLNSFIFCRGSILEPGVGKMPSSLVYQRESKKI